MIFKTLTGGTKLFVVVQTKLFFIQRQFRLQPGNFQLNGFDGIDICRGHTISAF